MRWFLQNVSRCGNDQETPNIKGNDRKNPSLLNFDHSYQRCEGLRKHDREVMDVFFLAATGENILTQRVVGECYETSPSTPPNAGDTAEDGRKIENNAVVADR